MVLEFSWIVQSSRFSLASVFEVSFSCFMMPTVLVGSSGLETYRRLILSWFLGASLPGQPLAYPEVVLPLVLSARGLIIEDDCTGSQTGQNEFAARISRPVQERCSHPERKSTERKTPSFIAASV